MSEETRLWADRWLGAASGDLPSLQMLRDEVIELCCAANIPWGETLAQAEIVARLAASREEPADLLALASLLIMRAANLRELADIDLCTAHDYLKQGMQGAFEMRLATGQKLNARADAYEREANGLFPAVVNGSEPESAAILISSLSQRADNGDDDALTTLQRLMDGLPRDRLASLKAALRTLEQVIVE